jgi:hypothetical protein
MILISAVAHSDWCTKCRPLQHIYHLEITRLWLRPGLVLTKQPKSFLYKNYFKYANLLFSWLLCCINVDHRLLSCPNSVYIFEHSWRSTPSAFGVSLFHLVPRSSLGVLPLLSEFPEIKYCNAVIQYVNSSKLILLSSINKVTLVQVSSCSNTGSIRDDRYWIS